MDLAAAIRDAGPAIVSIRLPFHCALGRTAAEQDVTSKIVLRSELTTVPVPVPGKSTGPNRTWTSCSAAMAANELEPESKLKN